MVLLGRAEAPVDLPSLTGLVGKRVGLVRGYAYGEQLLAHRHDGAEVSAERDGWIVFPNPAARVNEEWFYLAERSDRLAR